MAEVKMRYFAFADRESPWQAIYEGGTWQSGFAIVLLFALLTGFASHGHGQTNRVDKLIADLQSTGSYVSRRDAATALGEIKDPRAVEPLLLAVKESAAGVRSEAAKALGEIGDPRALQPLVVALKDTNAGVRSEVAVALGHLHDPATVEPLIAALKDSNAGAATALGMIKDTHAVEALVAALRDPDNAVRSEALKALSGIQDPRAAEAATGARLDELMATLKDHRSTPEAAGERRAAAQALARLGQPAVEPLIAALRDDYPEVRRQAAVALGQIKDSRAVEPLIAALHDADLRCKAAAALAEIKDPHGGSALAAAGITPGHIETVKIGPMVIREGCDERVVVKGWTRKNKDISVGQDACSYTVEVLSPSSLRIKGKMSYVGTGTGNLPKGVVLSVGGFEDILSLNFNKGSESGDMRTVEDAGNCRWSFASAASFEKDGVVITVAPGATIEFVDNGNVVTHGVEFKLKK
jgi:HEAT repeat protein